MTSNNKKVLVPQYIRKFSCIGFACEDTCCAGWKVDIDRSTYKKYNKVRDTILRKELDQYVKRNRSNPQDHNYAQMLMGSDESCSCPMLTGEKLCKIQVGLGESYLSNTCATYPRVTNHVNDVFEISTVMSCPETVRLALLNPAGIQFDQYESNYEIRALNQILDTRSEENFSKLERYFWDLRIFTIQVLQNRNESLPVRLFTLGMFYQKVQQYQDEGKLEQIPQLIVSYSQMFVEGEMGGYLQQLPLRLEIQMELLQQIINGKTTQGVSNQRYLECIQQFLDGLQCKEDMEVQELVARFKEANEEYYLPFISQHEYLLENYLVNSVFKDMFPIPKQNHTVFDAYANLILHFALIKIHLVGMAAYHKGLSEDWVIQLVQSFSKQFDHSPYLEEILTLLREDGMTNMAYMTILIQD